MESCLTYKPERVGAVIVEDLRKDLSVEFSKIPAAQESSSQEKEHLQVYLRIRPLTSTESDSDELQDYISIEPTESVVLKAPRASLAVRQSEKLGAQVAQRFQFSKVYGPDTTQREIFNGTTKALVKNVLKGENSLVFTYGVSNAGKTFTFLGPEADGGILPRSLHVIFNSIEGQIYTQNSIKPHRCTDYIRLTKDQQDEEATKKKNLIRRFKEIGLQKSTCNVSNSTCSSILEGSSYSDLDDESLCVEKDSHIKFSIWVSFCEIYNENIHDLLDVAPSSSQRRSVLRLCQDVKGNTFVRDLTWVHVNGTDEAYKILKIGRKNQSFSSTKLNSVSSRSHSIFSIRILRLEDLGVPRVQNISELSLCDLAGSERCAKTHNRGERLKEAGNINTSLLTLGKCISGLRLNQTQPKYQQHIPFRESKLTHYLQGFFCGRGKACMIVNINQCASMYDETLNVLKFSAVAQKVVVLNPKPVFSAVPKKSARDVSMVINNVDMKEWMRRRSTLLGWETSLEDVQEDEDDEEEEEDEESMVENTVLEAEDQDLRELHQTIKELQESLSDKESEKLAMESRIREEVTMEFVELFSNMEKDYNERLQREKEIATERAERRLEIFKNLLNETRPAEVTGSESRAELLDGMIEAIQGDLAEIKQDVEATQTCLENAARSPGAIVGRKARLDQAATELLAVKTQETEAALTQLQEANKQLLEANKNYENQVQRCQELMAICQEKDGMLSMLQADLDRNVEAATEDRAFIDGIKEEILHYRNNCKCLANNGREEMKDQELQRLVQMVEEKDELLAKLQREEDLLKENVKKLTDDLTKQAQVSTNTISMLETERATTTTLSNENRALANKLTELQEMISDMRSKLKALETNLSTQTSEVVKLSEELQTAKALLRESEDERHEQSSTIDSLKLEAENLRKKLHAHSQELSQERESDCAFRKTIEALRKECEVVVTASQEKNRRINALETQLNQSREEICQLENSYRLLGQERDGQMEAELAHREEVKRMEAELACRDEVEKRMEAELARRDEVEKRMEAELARRDEVEKRMEAELARRDEVEKRMEAELARRDEVEKRMLAELARRDEELETKAQEILKLEKQMTGELDKVSSLHADLEQKEECLSDLQAKISQDGAGGERLRAEVTTLTEEAGALRQKPDATEECDEAVRREQTNSREKLQYQDTQQVLQAKQELIEELRLCLADREKVHSEQERALGAQLKMIESLTEELRTLKEQQRYGESISSPAPHREDEGRGTAGHRTRARAMEGKSRGKVVTPTEPQKPQDNDQMTGQPEQETHNTVQLHEAGLQDSLLSTENKKDGRFPKPQVEISYTPLKPNRLNVRRPGGAGSVTVKIRSTARKRKHEENSVQSENRKHMCLQGNSRATTLPAQPSPLKHQDPPAGLRGRKDRALQKIEDFIQSSPTLLGGKAKKIIAMVKSPPTGTETHGKPKRSKRKLFKAQVSSPFDLPSPVIVEIDQDDKESDHFIIKRRLRTRTAKQL